MYILAKTTRVAVQEKTRGQRCSLYPRGMIVLAEGRLFQIVYPSFTAVKTVKSVSEMTVTPESPRT